VSGRNSGLLTAMVMWGLLLVSVACATGSVWGLWRCRRVRHRTRGLLGHRDSGAAAKARVPFEAQRKRLARLVGRGMLREGGAALGAGALAVTVVGGVTGWLVASAGAYGVWRWMRQREARRAAADVTAGARAAAEQLPLAAELMAACLAAGSGPAKAADAVGRSLAGPLGTRLLRTATELRLGAEPSAAWARFASLPGSDGFARSMVQAAAVGVPAVDQVTRLTVELRARQAREASARARRAAVLVTGPLGLCFLPAFLAVGVAPVVMGLAGALL
jgi:Type II secretion system (T2SS), protein F